MAEEQYVGTVHAQEAKKVVAHKADTVSEFPARPKGMDRRSFLMSWAGLAWGTFALGNAAGGIACLRFMLPNVLFEPPQVFKAGRLEDFEWDKPDESWTVDLRRFSVGTKELGMLKPEGIIMHPLPRGPEIDTAASPSAAVSMAKLLA